MKLSDRHLSWLLYLGGVGTLSAFIAVVLPAEWLRDIATWLGVAFPSGPLTIYLARHLSLLYGMVGVLFLWFAQDVRRYRPLLSKLGIAAVIFGLAQAIIGVTAAMPNAYTAMESLSTIFGGIGLYLVSRLPSANDDLAN